MKKLRIEEVNGGFHVFRSTNDGRETKYSYETLSDLRMWKELGEFMLDRKLDIKEK